MNIVAIIQARMSSTRLPGKALMEIHDKPMLHCVIQRVRQTRTLNLVAVATTVEPEDDAIEQYAKTVPIPCFRGSRDDVLDRYYRAAELFQADVIVRLTADCPLLDPAIIDRVVQKYLEGGFDYASNITEPTFPDGLDTEVFSRSTLSRAWREARLPSEREHVTPYIRNHPALFRQGIVKLQRDLSHLRWTVDEPEDLDLVRRIYHYLQDKAEFGMDDVLALFDEHNELKQINAGFMRNEGYIKSLNEDISRSKGSK